MSSQSLTKKDFFAINLRKIETVCSAEEKNQLSCHQLQKDARICTRKYHRQLESTAAAGICLTLFTKCIETRDNLALPDELYNPPPSSYCIAPHPHPHPTPAFSSPCRTLAGAAPPTPKRSEPEPKSAEMTKVQILRERNVCCKQRFCKKYRRPRGFIGQVV